MPCAAHRRGRRAARAGRPQPRRPGRPRRHGHPRRPRHGRGPARQPAARPAPTANARRIVAYGLRNPFRFTIRPGTNEVWVGDVGWNTVGGDRPASPTPGRHRRRTSAGPATRAPTTSPATTAAGLTSAAPLRGPARRSRPTSPTATRPRRARRDVHRRAARRSRASPSASTAAAPTRRPTTARCSSPTTRATASGSCSAAAERCRARRTRAPSLRRRPTRSTSRSSPTATCTTSDFDGGTIRRIVYTAGDQPPVAIAGADRTSGDLPLTVAFDASASRDPDGSTAGLSLRVGPRRRRSVQRLDRGQPDVHVHDGGDLHGDRARHRPGWRDRDRRGRRSPRATRRRRP